MKSSNAIHPDLLAAKNLAYEPSSLMLKKLILETESQEYAACIFALNDTIILFRVAKITPKKIGQFVTLWKRIENNPIVPYDQADPIDFFVVSVNNGQRLGQFVFPKETLCRQGFVSKNKIGGKRAMRVYPPWDQPKSPQAQSTQTWQLKYFIEIKPTIDYNRVKKMFYQSMLESSPKTSTAC